MDKKTFMKTAKEQSEFFLNMKGGYDEQMKGWFKSCDYENQTVTYGYKTQKWQTNEHHTEIHGGVIAGMFDTALGTVCNFLAGERGSTTAELSVSFLRVLPLGTELEVITHIIKVGRKAIRVRGEMMDVETGKLIATATGTWMPL